MKLTTYVSAINDDGTTEVKWRTGESSNGVVVTPPVEIDGPSEQSIIGELIAINYLVSEKKVFGNTVMSGKGISLDVSKGAIRKIQRKACSKKNVAKYGAFLRNSLHGVVVKVTKSEPILTDAAEIEKLNEIDLLRQNTVETPALGTVKITEHALDRYIERISGSGTKNPRASLLKKIKDPGLSLVQLPEKVVNQKKRKYGTKDTPEVWMVPKSDLKLQLVRSSEGIRTLVTVFQRAA